MRAALLQLSTLLSIMYVAVFASPRLFPLNTIVDPTQSIATSADVPRKLPNNTAHSSYLTTRNPKLFLAMDTHKEFEQFPDMDFDEVDCSPQAGNWHGASLAGVKQGIWYLDNKKGPPGVGEGRGTCARISCEKGNAIFWCNNSSRMVLLDTCKPLAEAARKLVEKCPKKNGEDAQVLGTIWSEGRKTSVQIHSVDYQCS